MKEIKMNTAEANIIDKHIVQFMKEQTVLTIATCNDNIPHCAMCFYVFVEELDAIVFKSKPSTTHVNEGIANANVAGSILPDKFTPGKTSGIQFNGEFKVVTEAEHAIASKSYYKKYPFAAVMPGELWMIALTNIVFTDATLGFGKKRVWRR
jgi:uncharacterized protein YhbP (UPF0306 family)